MTHESTASAEEAIIDRLCQPISDTEQLALLELELRTTVARCSANQISGKDAWSILNLISESKVKLIE